MIKQIEKIVSPPSSHWVGDGFHVHTFFPGSEIGLNRMSPFFLLDYNARTYMSPRETPRGVGVHPHRGFETVTIAYKGKVAHHDSFGNSGVINEGDIQWMTAGSGLLHKEYHEKEFSKNGGDFHFVQLWVNLPAASKMTKPNYQSIEHSKMGKVQLPDSGGEVEILAGQFNGTKGPAHTFTPLELYNVRLKKGTDLKLDFPENYNTGILVVEGNVTINTTHAVKTDHFVLFRNAGSAIGINATSDCLLLVLSGEPIREPVSAYGPFVMNTEEEIEQAFQDLRTGKFGHLEDHEV
jgi:quercetin 2,3-dioxygenase